MAGDCTHMKAHYKKVETFCPSKPWSDEDGDRGMQAAGNMKGRGLPARWSPNFETIDGLLYRKKLEKGFFNYREVLEEDRRQEALSTFHRRRLGQPHLSLEETYKCVAENYWWEGMRKFTAHSLVLRILRSNAYIVYINRNMQLLYTHSQCMYISYVYICQAM